MVSLLIFCAIKLTFFFQARNEEKAQSMLYRFREAQAAELGLGTRADRRPRMASACKSLRECERWRGEILREISRKVSKIQDCLSITPSPYLRGTNSFDSWSD